MEVNSTQLNYQHSDIIFQPAQQNRAADSTDALLISLGLLDKLLHSHLAFQFQIVTTISAVFLPALLIVQPLILHPGLTAKHSSSFTLHFLDHSSISK